jgi:hypothetical protein
MTRGKWVLRGAASVALAVSAILAAFGTPGVSADHQDNGGEFAPPGCAFGNDRANEQTAEAPGCAVAEEAREANDDRHPGRGHGPHKDGGAHAEHGGHGGHGDGGGRSHGHGGRHR